MIIQKIVRITQLLKLLSIFNQVTKINKNSIIIQSYYIMLETYFIINKNQKIKQQWMLIRIINKIKRELIRTILKVTIIFIILIILIILNSMMKIQ